MPQSCSSLFFSSFAHLTFKDDKTVRFMFKKMRRLSIRSGHRRRGQRGVALLIAGDLDELDIDRASQQRRDRDLVEDAMDEIGDARPDRLQTTIVLVDADLLVARKLCANLFFGGDAAEGPHDLAQRDLVA